MGQDRRARSGVICALRSTSEANRACLPGRRGTGRSWGSSRAFCASRSPWREGWPSDGSLTRARDESGLRGGPGLLRCLAFEGIVEIRITPVRPCPQTGARIRWHEQRPPALALAHVHALVFTLALETPGALPDDNVAKGERVGTTEGHQPFEQMAPPAPAHFDRTCASSDPTSAHERETREQQSEQSGRRGPEVDERPQQNPRGRQVHRVSMPRDDSESQLRLRRGQAPVAEDSPSASGHPTCGGVPWRI